MQGNITRAITIVLFAGTFVIVLTALFGTVDLPASIGKILPFSTINQNARFDRLVAEVNVVPGIYGIYIKNLTTNATFTHNAEHEFYAASLYKLLVALAVQKAVQDGQLTWDTRLTVNYYDMQGGTGVLSLRPAGQSYTVEELVGYLLKESDNTAQNVLSGQSAISSQMDEIALAYTGNANSRFLADNVASAQVVGGVLERMVGNDLLEVMKVTSFDDRISAGLSENMVFSHKIGNWGDTGSWHDCGVVFGSAASEPAYVICVMSENTNFESFLHVTRLVGGFVE